MKMTDPKPMAAKKRHTPATDLGSADAVPQQTGGANFHKIPISARVEPVSNNVTVRDSA